MSHDKYLSRRAILWRAANLSASTLAGLLTACRSGQAQPTAQPEQVTATKTSTTSAAATTAPTPVTPASTPNTGASPTRRATPPLASPAASPVASPAGPGTPQAGPRQVFQSTHVYEPHIAVDPTNPRRLGAIVVNPAVWLCTSCPHELLLGRSDDSGATWEEQPLTGQVDGVVGFGPDGTFYAVGLVNDEVGLFRLPASQPVTATALAPTTVTARRTMADKPWLTIDSRTGALYVAYTGSTSDHTNGILFQQSTDGGATWTAPVVVEPGVERADWQAGHALPPTGAQVIVGNSQQLAVAWTLERGVDQYPKEVWLATSEDGGQTFAAPRTIDQSWGFISTAAHDGSYYIAYQTGTVEAQQLTIVRSTDGGATWQATNANGAIPLSFDPDKAAGINCAPNGRVDLVFYAPEGGQPIDFNTWRQFRQSGWVDPRHYRVYYTWSADRGQSFHQPQQLTTTPITGAWFIQTNGASRPGEYIGVASTDQYAYPIWIATPAKNQATAVTMRLTHRTH